MIPTSWQHCVPSNQIHATSIILNRYLSKQAVLYAESMLAIDLNGGRNSTIDFRELRLSNADLEVSAPKKNFAIEPSLTID